MFSGNPNIYIFWLPIINLFNLVRCAYLVEGIVFYTFLARDLVYVVYPDMLMIFEQHVEHELAHLPDAVLQWSHDGSVSV